MNDTNHRRALLAALRLIARCFIAAAFGIPATAALAGVIVVTGFDDVIVDDDICTLREAILSANGDDSVGGCVISGPADDDVIELTAGTYAVDLANGTAEDASENGDLDIVSSLEIRGIAPEYTVIDGNADTSQERVFDVGPNSPNIVVTIRDVTITGGREPGSGGGNIRNQAQGNAEPGLTLHNAVISGGRAVFGAGMDAGGSVVISRSVVRGNVALGDDGGGGGIAFGGTQLDVRESEISNNRAANGGGLYGFGNGSWTVADSRVTENRAEAGPGASPESGRGGGIASTGGAVTVTRTLIEGNEAASGGGLWLAVNNDEVTHSAIVGNTASENGGGVYSTADNFIRHSTIAGNEAAFGGGVYADSPANFLLDAVTLAGNTGGGGVFNESGAVIEFSLLADNVDGNCLENPPTAGMLNLDDGVTCDFPADDPNDPQFVDTDPMLGPLQDNGGGLPTFALLDGSPAIDAVSSTVRTDCQKTPDQRGYPRGWPPVEVMVQDTEFLCDIGAFERHATYVVDTTADTVDALEEDGVCADMTGACSLRAAIMTANTVPGFEEIELAADTYSITLPGAGENDNETGDFDITDVVLVRGQGADQTIVDAAQLDRAFHFVPVMAPENPLTPDISTLSDLSIQQGTADEGGGILLADRRLRLERTVLRDNRAASGDGGALLCVDDCDIWITDSTLGPANIADAGFGGAIRQAGGILHLERSTLSGNRSLIGGAIDVAGGALRALNATFSGNTAGSFAAFDASQFVLESSTVFDNEADVNGDTLLSAYHVIGNSIVAGNRVDGAPDNCGFSPDRIVSVGFNLSDTDSTDCNLTHATDLIDIDPLLEPLADNDGLTETHALTAESPAIDAGDDERCPAMDQRGFARPDDGDGDGTAVCDIGAYEALSADLAIAIVDSPDPVDVDNDVTYTVTVTNNGPGPASQVVVSTTLPAGLELVTADVGGTDCAASGGAVDCDIGDIAAGDGVEIRIVATAAQSGELTVEATVTAAEADGATADNTVTETTTVNATGGGGGGGSGGGGGGGGSGGGNGGGSGGGAVSWPVLLGLLALCRRRRFSLVLAALLLGVNGCGGGGGGGDSANPPPPPPPSSTWDDMNWDEGEWG